IAVDRNDASAHAQIGRLKVDVGEPAQALPHIELALRLSPLDPQRPLWFTFAGLALLHIGDPAAARSWLEKSVAVAPRFVTSLVVLAAAQQLEGHSEEARRTIAAVRLKETKTGRARAVALPSLVVEELRRHRIEQAQELLRIGMRQDGESFVYAREDGQPMQP